ncbi:uncharacterized protein K452DRAFT_294267 [Aplosporella prunicola CBS 121167]|uniref:Extracellular membrane protein CFEM domain-containing protein n=1 Tax=Aplosporella prunicola CBS 121167 TaxID=1176127 RepID=A0A6A6BRJ3_9PEZI|nr:uncharacterized protein K452DRAFT_294267 [Aplosporella prunicola CBS 121167]KAF2146719.1 hypothetical protein K452DRAFT_294267 [Aplosporella prunicola CBS 121167]
MRFLAIISAAMAFAGTVNSFEYPPGNLDISGLPECMQDCMYKYERHYNVSASTAERFCKTDKAEVRAFKDQYLYPCYERLCSRAPLLIREWKAWLRHNCGSPWDGFQMPDQAAAAAQ